MIVRARLEERGFTLTELVVVMVLASVVTLGLVIFYLHAQLIWMEGSTQALAQRDGTALVEFITTRARACQSATVIDSPDPLHQKIILVDQLGESDFRWDLADSLVHADTLIAGVWNDKGPAVQSKVTRFQLERDANLVFLNMLEVESANGAKVQLSSTAAFYNR